MTMRALGRFSEPPPPRNFETHLLHILTGGVESRLVRQASHHLKVPDHSNYHPFQAFKEVAER